jgi:hypothetical protein
MLNSATRDMKDGVVMSTERLEEFRDSVAEHLANRSIKDDISMTACGNSLTIAVKDKEKIKVYQTELYKVYEFIVKDSAFKFEIE